MKELGESTDALHFSLGEYAARAGTDTVITFGELAKNIADGAISVGMHKDSVISLEDIGEEETSDLLGKILKRGDVILVKASRSMRGERVIELLKKLYSEN